MGAGRDEGAGKFADKANPRAVLPLNFTSCVSRMVKRAPFSYIYALALFHPTSHIDMRTGREPRDFIKQPSHLKEEQEAALSVRDSATQLASWAYTVLKLTDG